MSRWFLLALLPTCVATMDVPRKGPCEDTLDCQEALICVESTCQAVCDDANCAPFSCDSATNACFRICQTDDQCSFGASCEANNCLAACEVEGCEDNFACNVTSGLCYELCYTDEECDEDSLCCNDAAIDAGTCDDASWGNCYR